MKYIHLKSNELVNGNPKLPPVSGMQVGEIAINYKDGYETLFIKNDNNEIVSFSSDDIIIAQAGGGGLPTGTTLDNVPDGSTRKLSNYALQSDFASHTASTLHMPAVTSSDNGKILQVVNGAWALVSPVSIYYGSTVPDNNMGNDGDIYIQQ